MDTIEILKQLISIPSWVGEGCNEIKISNWIYNYLKNNSDLNIFKQKLEGERFNIIAKKGIRVDTLVTGHIDTVQPSKNWTKNPFNVKVEGEKLYGLGSSDMLAGVSIMLNIACQKDVKDNAMFLFYCDEEYDFLGMKKFIGRFKGKINPKLIISLDGEGLQIGNSCRGLIEMKVKVKGVAGHAANSKSGINAITESFKVIKNLKSWVNDFKSDELGNSTLNIAYIRGGGTEGNVIADNCEYIVEIRVANEKLDARLVAEFIKEKSQRLGLKIEEIITRHNLGSWITRKEELINIVNLIDNKNLKSARKSGYIDIQMLWKEFGKVPTFSLGAGEIGQSHKSDEYVKISNVLKAQKFYESILTDK